MLDTVETSTEALSWGIREFAQMFDVTPRTLRFYEDKGLLKPARHAGSRIFTLENYLRFERIMRAKRIGFTLDDIKEVLEVMDGHITDRVELLRRKKNFEAAIGSLERRQDDIAVISKDMTDICAVIAQEVEEASNSDNIFDLAAAYDAKFKQTLADDYSVDILEL